MTVTAWLGWVAAAFGWGVALTKHQFVNALLQVVYERVCW